MGEFERDLRRTLQGRAAQMSGDAELPESLRHRVQRARRRKATVIAGTAITALVLIAGGVALAQRGDHERIDTVATPPAACAGSDVPDVVQRIAFDSAAGSEPRPRVAQYVTTSRSAAGSVASGPGAVNDDSPSYLVQIAGGSFRSGRQPATAPSARVLTVTISIAEQFVTDAGYTDTEVDLRPLGAVGEFSLDPRCAPPMPSTTTVTEQPVSTTTTTTTPTGPAQCTNVVVTFVQSQGAAGSQIGSFWVRNPGRVPCVVHGDLVVELLDQNGKVLKTITPPAVASASLVLAPHPEEPTNPPPSGLAEFELRWQELDLANGGAPCPQPPLAPAQVRATFDHGAAQATTDATPRDGSFPIQACNGEIDMSELRPLG
jgi:hypothetical protein